MTQSPRSFDSYTQALLLSIEEEHMGETYFATLAKFHTGSAKQAFLIMSQIEAAVILAMQPLLDRLGLAVADQKTVRALGVAEAERLRGQSWQEFLIHMNRDYPAFLEEFDQILALSPASDLKYIQVLSSHERAFIDFGRAEQRGDTNSHRHLNDFLAEVTAFRG